MQTTIIFDDYEKFKNTKINGVSINGVSQEWLDKYSFNLREYHDYNKNFNNTGCWNNLIKIKIRRNIEWAENFKNTVNSYNEDFTCEDKKLKKFILGKGIGSVGQSYFPNKNKNNENISEKIFDYLKKNIELIRIENTQLQDSDLTDIDKFEQDIFKVGTKKCWLAVHAMVCALNPNLFCNVLNKDYLDELYEKLLELYEDNKDKSRDTKTEKGVIYSEKNNNGETEDLIIDLSKLGNEVFWKDKDEKSWYTKSNAIKKFFDDENDSEYKHSDCPFRTLMALRGDVRINEIAGRLEKQKNIILTGAPGTGKTYLAREIAKKMIPKDDNTGGLERIYKEQIEFVQFHPSYDYSDFVEGLRPTMEGDTVVFKRMDGTFKSFCEKAAKNKDKKYIFIIDEINRGEISKIFGELFFSIDPGYREGGKDKIFVKTQYHKMIETEMKEKETDYSFKDGFFVPNNVYIIGTMNDIDRSVDSMDFAFRRRFAFVEITADESEVIIYNNEELKESHNKYDREGLRNRMNSLNKAIIDPQKGGLSTEYQIGGAYFLKIKDVNYSYSRLWNEYIKGVLIEYFRGNPKQKEILDQLKEAYNCGSSK